MIELTQGAQGRLDDYLCEMRQALSGSASVDPVEVERDVRDHIDEALAGHVGPVEASALDDVLRTLGSPAQWLPPERESASFRKFSAELLSPFKEAVFEIGRRLTGGPECYRLAYLSLLLLVAGFCLFPLLDAHRDLGFLPILAIIVSFVFARAALSLFGAPRLTGGQKWLLYPSLWTVYVPVAALILIGPVTIAGAFVIKNGSEFNQAREGWGNEMFPFERKADPRESPIHPPRPTVWGKELTPVVVTGGLIAVAGANWFLVGLLGTLFPGAIRNAFHPFADRFSRRIGFGLAFVGLTMSLGGLVILR